MRALAIILACLVGPIGGLPISTQNSSTGKSAEKCCCCPDRTVCRCGCEAPADDRSPTNTQEPRRLYCSCDSAPLGPLPAGYHAPAPRVIETLPADDVAGGRQLSSFFMEVRALVHGPPPDLPFLRTIILLA